MARTPLLKAVTRGDARAVRKVLAKSLGGINDADEAGDRPLHVAARLGHELVVAALLENGAEVDLPNAAGETALWVASDRGDLPCVEALLAHGADADLTNAAGVKPARRAFDNHHMGVAAAFLAHPASGSPEEQQKLLGMACMLPFPELLRLMLQEPGVDVNAVLPGEGTMALQVAVYHGHIGIVLALLEAGACPLVQAEKNGQTPLYVACGSDPGSRWSPDMVDLLLTFQPLCDCDRQCDSRSAVNLQDHEQRTPLTLAAFQENAALVATLLEHGADVSVRGYCGATALHYAALQGNREITALLLPLMSADDINHRCRLSPGSPLLTAVDIAICEGHNALMVDLLRGGADIELLDVERLIEKTIVRCPHDLRCVSETLFSAACFDKAIQCALRARKMDGNLGPLPAFAARMNDMKTGHMRCCYCCQPKLLSVECGKCKVARYCSKWCKQAHGRQGHQLECARLADPELARLTALRQTEGVKKLLRLRGQWKATTDADADAYVAARARARAVLGYRLGCAYAAAIAPSYEDLVKNLEQAAEHFRLSAAFFCHGTPENATVNTARARALLRLLRVRRR